jgi:hypothetical protein
VSCLPKFSILKKRYEQAKGLDPGENGPLGAFFAMAPAKPKRSLNHA